MTLFDDRNPYDAKKFYREKLSPEDRRNRALMAEARETKERVRHTERGELLETKERVLGDLSLEELLEHFDGTSKERRHRASIVLHRRGDYLLTDVQRFYQRRKKTNWRRRHRAKKAAAQEAAQAAAEAKKDAAEKVTRERALAYAKAAVLESISDGLE